MLRYVTLRYVTLRYVNHSFKLSRLFYCKNLLKTFITCHYEGNARSNLFSVDCFTWQHARFSAFAMTIKNQFEIISQSNYGFCYKNYFFNLNQVFRNNYDFCESFERNSNYDFEKNYNASFGKNNFGNCNFGFDFGNMIYDIGNNLAGFLFNRKINSKKILKQGEQK